MTHAPPTLRPLAVLACASLAWGAPESGHGQSADSGSFVLEPRAWVGILADVGMDAEGRFAILVRDAHIAGPAHREGIMRGDRVVALNGRGIVDFEHWLGQVSRLEVGEVLVLTVARGGVTRHVQITAEQRPGWLAIDSVALDTIQSRVWQRFDSIYSWLADGGGDDSVFLAALNPRQRLHTAEGRVQVSWERRGARSVSATLRVRTGVREDSATERARTALATRREELDRRELAEATPAPVGGGGGGEPETVTIARAETGSPTFLQERRWVLQERRWVLLGGVLVRDLTDELGRAFGVADGVLVTDVWQGSPASRTGFRAGDVIAGVAEQPVRSVLDLRIALAEASLPVRIAVVRRGETIELVYPPK